MKFHYNCNKISKNTYWEGLTLLLFRNENELLLPGARAGASQSIQQLVRSDLAMADCAIWALVDNLD